MPRGGYKVDGNFVSQEYALFCNGQFVSQAWGEQSYDEQGVKSIATALEGAKSNALMRCCKVSFFSFKIYFFNLFKFQDIGIASELWDINFINEWKSKFAVSVWCEHVTTGTKKLLWRRKDRPAFEYPYREGVRGETK